MAGLVAQRSVRLNAPVFAEFLREALQPAWGSLFYATGSIQARYFTSSWDASACTAISSAAE